MAGESGAAAAGALATMNPYIMGGMAVASLISANSKRKAQMKAMIADAKLQRARLERARVSAAETYQTNSQRAREGAQEREINIEQSRLQAESKLASAFAGSGISGTSVNEIDDQIDTEVAQNKFQNKKQLDQNLSDQVRQFSNQMNDTALQAAAINTTPIKGNFFADLAGAAGAAQSANNAVSSLQDFLSSNKNSSPVPKNSSNDFVGPRQSKKSYFGGVERTLGLNP